MLRFSNTFIPFCILSLTFVFFHIFFPYFLFYLHCIILQEIP